MEFLSRDISMCLTAFIFGTIFADILNYIAYRLCKKEIILTVSCFVRRGKCKCCDKKILLACLLRNVVLAAVFMLCTLKFDSIPYLILILFLVSVLYIITLTDLQKRIIPNECVIVAVLVRILYFFIMKETKCYFCKCSK